MKRVVTGQANLLLIPMQEIRRTAESIGPRMVTYGLTDACKTALAAPLTKLAMRNHVREFCFAARMKSPKAAAKIANDKAIVRL